jgi:DNA-binding CsgD family transcriptional regulator
MKKSKGPSDSHQVKVLNLIDSGDTYFTVDIAKKVSAFYKALKIINENLTIREQRIVWCVMDGMNYEQIMENLCIAEVDFTIDIQSIYKKLSINSESELANLLKKKDLFGSRF